MALPQLRAVPAAATGERVELTPELIGRLLVEAQARNPALQAAGARAEAASAAVDAVRTWEDPTLTVGLSLPTARGFKSSEEGNLIYGVEQKLPVFDRPKLARQAAETGAAKGRLTVAYETARLRRDLTLALVDLALDDSTLALARQDIGWLEATLSAVDHRYRVGKASQVEWLKMQIEQAKALDHLKTLELEREHQQVELNRLLNRDLHAAWPVVALPPLPAAIAYSDELVQAALQSEPKLKVLQQEIAQAEAVSRVTRQQRQPDIGVGVQGRSYTGDAGFREGMVTVNLTLPWLNARRYDSDFQRDRAWVRASERDAADYQLSIREKIHQLTVELDTARRQAVLYRDELIPLAEQTLASATAAWANNLGLFQDVLDARRMLVDQRLRREQARAGQARQLAELGLLTGTTDFSVFPPPAAPAAQAMNLPGASK